MCERGPAPPYEPESSHATDPSVAALRPYPPIMHPETRYAIADGARIAYQVFGEGPPTLVTSAGSFSHTDVIWEDPEAALFLTRLASLGQVIRYDRLGTSNSDPFPPGWDATWDGYADELDAVLAAAGADRVVLFAMLDAGAVAIRYAAERPDRVERLILYNTSARFIADVDYEIGYTTEAVDQLIGALGTTWGSAAQVTMNVPSRSTDERFSAWYSKYVRSIGTPTTIVDALSRVLRLDVRPWLEQVRVPTLVLHRTDYAMVPLAQGRFVADLIPGATFVELPGADGPMMWETPDLILDEIRSFLTAETGPRLVTRLETVLFTDIVRSTARAAAIGDREWTTLLSVHDDIAARLVAGAGGRVVKSTGDGILAAFGDPASAVACASRLTNELLAIGLTIRAGVHTGQVEDHGTDVGGIAVHIAARVMAAAADGTVAVSRTVRDLLLGTDFRFEALGAHDLKGVDGPWELFELT